MTTATITPTVTRPFRDWLAKALLRWRLARLERDIEGGEQDIERLQQQNGDRRDEARRLAKKLRTLKAL